MNRIIAYIKLTRPLNVVIGILGVLLGAYLTGDLRIAAALWCAVITVITFTGAANAINDYYDYEIDKINRPERPLPAGLIPRSHARIFAYAMFTIGVVSSALISSLAFAIAVGSAGFLVGYSRWWKRQPIFGNVVVGLMIGVAFVYGAAAFGDPWAAWPPAFMGFLYTWGREIIKDLEDAEGDASLDAKTLPLLVGESRAKFFSSGLFLLLIFGVLAPYLMNIYNTLYLIMVVVGVDVPILYITVQLWRSQSSADYRRLSQILKADMFVGLLAVFVGTF
ncbi:MAG: geranylgeranylglycerol-phosphate geranylgeranyltransferase [Candidatus Marinimicrobia bacterium]|nr:geranylgeranylglycerol-phosphate geranylgeranyltransferase [Candidatus Neomarinimicrobiota bacterium]MCF7828841.1 geranylgeranylglycerol-phosphate geranylgeranyltransferase [Candidatus Neomarinimicrobiota bacterium]MCF7880758.1 geranylgeranylglycerol-phosphate geranylgeranyltransferase [Candidatus Neomarinimicrobiota bacterium]